MNRRPPKLGDEDDCVGHPREEDKPRGLPKRGGHQEHSPMEVEERLPVMGPTRLWVWSCWMEEIRRPAEEKSQKSQRGQSHFGRSHTDHKSRKELRKSQIGLRVL